MKNALIVSGLMLLFFASCKKNRTCNCYNVYEDEEYSYTINDTKLGAKRTCEVNGPFSFDNCTLED